MSLAKDLKADLNTIKETGNKKEIKDAVFKFIEFHSDVQQLSTTFNVTYILMTSVSL